MLRTVLAGNRLTSPPAHQPRTITMVAALVVALGTFGCAGDTEPKEPTAADDGIEVGAGPADPQDLAAYRDERNVICEAGTAKIDQIKLAIQGGRRTRWRRGIAASPSASSRLRQTSRS